MHGGGGVAGIGIPNGELEFQGVSSPGILRRMGGKGAKNSDLLTSEVRKTSLVCTRAEQTEPQRYDYEVGMRSLFRTAMKFAMLSAAVPVVF